MGNTEMFDFRSHPTLSLAQNLKSLKWMQRIKQPDINNSTKSNPLIKDGQY